MVIMAGIRKNLCKIAKMIIIYAKKQENTPCFPSIILKNDFYLLGILFAVYKS